MTASSISHRRPNHFLAAPIVALCLCTGCGAGSPAPGHLEPPVFVLAFDGISLDSLVRDGTTEIDAERFPHVAELAGRSTLFTLALAPSDQPDESFEAFVRGSVAAEETRRATLCSLLAGAELRWNDSRCGAERRTPAAADTEETSDEDRATRFRRFVDQLRADSAGGSLGHYVLHSRLPDVPWHHLADGRRYRPALHEIPGRFGEFWGPQASLVEQGRLRHAEQLRFVDSLVGELVAGLAQLGLSERSTLVLLATRGVSFRPGEKILQLSDGNADQILRVPVLVHAPGQQRAAVVDSPVSLADLPPWLDQALGVGRESDGGWSPPPFTATGTPSARGLRVAPFPLDPGRLGTGSTALPPTVPTPGASLAPGPGTGPRRPRVASPLPTGIVVYGLAPGTRGTLGRDDVPVLLAGRLVGGADSASLSLEVDGRVVDHAEAYGPPGGELWFSFLRRDDWQLGELNRLSLWVEDAAGGRARLQWMPNDGAAPEDDGSADCRISAFAESTQRLGDEILLHGRVTAREVSGDELRIEIHHRDRLLYSRYLAGDWAAGQRFVVRLPALLVPGSGDEGIRAAVAGGGCRRAWMRPLVSASLRGAEVESVSLGTGQASYDAPGTLAGAVELADTHQDGVVIVGWAADLAAGEPAQRIAVLRGDRVVALQQPELQRPDLAAYFGSQRLLDSGFEIEVDRQPGDLRVVAIRGSELSNLSLAAPRISTSLFREILHVDEFRSVPVLSLGSMGWIESVSLSDDGWTIDGWAGDTRRREAAVMVYAFQDDEALAAARVVAVRPDVAAALGTPGVASGFRLVVPADRRSVRVLALTEGGRAGRLLVHEGVELP